MDETKTKLPILMSLYFYRDFTYYSGCIADIFQTNYFVFLTTLRFYYKIFIKLQVDFAELGF